MSVGLVKMGEDSCKIMCYDDTRAALIVDTLETCVRLTASNRRHYVGRKGLTYDPNAPDVWEHKMKVIGVNDLVHKWFDVYRCE